MILTSGRSDVSSILLLFANIILTEKRFRFNMSLVLTAVRIEKGSIKPKLCIISASVITVNISVM